MDIELTKSKLADAYITGLQWVEVAIKIPEANVSMFKEIVDEVEAKLHVSSNQINPQEYYRGVGVEVEKHKDGLLLSIIYKDCPAACLGAKAGDILTKVNFHSINNMEFEDSLKTLRNSDYEEGIILEVIRNGEVVTLGYGRNVQPKVIDAKQKYPLSFTALTIGKRLRQMQGAVNIGLSSNIPIKKRDFAMSL